MENLIKIYENEIKIANDAIESFRDKSGYIIATNIAVARKELFERVVSDLRALATQQQQGFEQQCNIGDVSNNEADRKYKLSCGHDYCNLDECPEYEPKCSEVAFCGSPFNDFNNCPLIKQTDNCKKCFWYEPQNDC